MLLPHMPEAGISGASVLQMRSRGYLKASWKQHILPDDHGPTHHLGTQYILGLTSDLSEKSPEDQTPPFPLAVPFLGCRSPSLMPP